MKFCDDSFYISYSFWKSNFEVPLKLHHFFVLISHLLYHCSNEFAEIIIKCITNCINNDIDYSNDLDDLAGLSIPPENVRNPFVKNETFGKAVFLWILQNF